MRLTKRRRVGRGCEERVMYVGLAVCRCVCTSVFGCIVRCEKS